MMKLRVLTKELYKVIYRPYYYDIPRANGKTLWSISRYE